MRFGGDMASTLHSWKHYRGPSEHRKPRDNLAWYHQLGGSASWMYFEFISMCEEIDIIPVIGLDFAHGAIDFIKNNEFCIKSNNEFCIKNDELNAGAIDDTADIVEYLLRGICSTIHNRSHNLPLILGLNCVYIFPVRRYLYSGADSTYGALRAKDGHPDPYGAVWFEFGNEVSMSDRYAIFILNASSAMEARR